MLAEAMRRQRDMIAGVKAYLDHPELPPREAAGEIVWQSGSSRLLRYGGPGRRPVLLVPSLINRYDILDLDAERSLARYLSEERTIYLLDWGAPGRDERAYRLADYVTERLEHAAAWIAGESGTAPALFGYCMGGLLSMALAGRRPDLVSALALAAVPWDFHARDSRTMRLSAALTRRAAECLRGEDPVSGELILGLFYWNDPWRFEEKFIRFGALDVEARARFVRIERWANDCIALAAPAARDCLVGWLQENALVADGWKIDGWTVEPEDIACPILFAVAERDRVVSPGSAQALVDRCPSARVIRPATGHVGMIVGERRVAELWSPLRSWLRETLA